MKPKNKKNIDWKVKKLGEVCDFQNGFAFKSKLFSEDGFPILRISNIQNDKISYEHLVYFRKESYDIDFEKYEVHKGDLVIAMSGATTGKLAISDTNEIFYLNQRVGKFKPKKSLFRDFLYYFLTTRIEENLKISQGTAQPNLSTEQIKNFEIPVPPLDEQRRIVGILDEVFTDIEKARENAEKNLENAKELFESYLEKVFEGGDDWEEKKLGEIYDVRDGTHDSPTYQNSGHLLITSKNLRGGFNIKNAKFISEDDFRKINERSKVDKGDILFAMIGTIGTPTVIEQEPDFAIKNVALFKTPKAQNNYFLKYYLESPFVIDKMQREAKGSTQKFVGLGYLRNFPIKLPPLQKQKEIVKKLDELSESVREYEAILRSKIADLDELKKSVLEKAFSGEL